MKSFELQPTEENIWETYDKDMLGRNADIFSFVLLLDSVDTSFSIALDAQWGDGKTFFVKRTKMVLDAYNDYTESPYGDYPDAVLFQDMFVVGTVIAVTGKAVQLPDQNDIK